MLALLLAACISAQSREATRVLRDIEVAGGPSELKASTPEPSRTGVAYEIDGRRSIADLYDPNQPIGAGLVLVPGFTPDGKDDKRLVELAKSLARARFLVLVPDLVGSRELRVRTEDAEGIADAVAYLAEGDVLESDREIGLVAISYAVGLAILASERADIRDELGFLVGVGGYHDTAAVVTFATTGGYRAARAQPWSRLEPNPAAKWLLLASNVDLLANAEDRRLLSEIADSLRRRPGEPVDDLVEGLGPEGLALWSVMDNRDSDRTRELLKRLPDSIAKRLQDLSPAGRNLDHLEGRLILVHGREDTLVPYTESAALARAVSGTRLYLIDGFSHIEPSDVGLIGQLRLIDAVQAVLDRRAQY